ncbi:MAG: hypothetical protein KDD89_14145 [Anaerolineales bacterium]|nr:hypothetical protein [Anaerolineales bacterium]
MAEGSSTAVDDGAGAGSVGQCIAIGTDKNDLVPFHNHRFGAGLVGVGGVDMGMVDDGIRHGFVGWGMWLS